MAMGQSFSELSGMDGAAPAAQSTQASCRGLDMPRGTVTLAACPPSLSPRRPGVASLGFSKAFASLGPFPMRSASQGGLDSRTLAALKYHRPGQVGRVTISCHLIWLFGPAWCMFACVFQLEAEEGALSLSTMFFEAGSLTEPGARPAARAPHDPPEPASHSTGVIGARVTFYAGAGFKLGSSCVCNKRCYLQSHVPCLPSLTSVLGLVSVRPPRSPASIPWG